MNSIVLKYTHVSPVEELNVLWFVEKHCRCLKYKTPSNERGVFRKASTTELVFAKLGVKLNQ